MKNIKEDEYPYENDPNSSEQLTIGMLKKAIESIPDDYEVSFDSALGYVALGDFRILHKKRKISING